MSPEEKKPGKPQKPVMEEPKVIVAGTIRDAAGEKTEEPETEDVKVPSAYRLLFQDKPEGTQAEFELVRGFNFMYGGIVAVMIIVAVAAAFFAGVFMVDKLSTIMIPEEAQEQGQQEQ